MNESAPNETTLNEFKPNTTQILHVSSNHSSHTSNSTVHTPAGTLLLEVEDSVYPLEELCGFANRANAKRGFLFVSKVLGKHIPVAPRVVIQSHQRLAALLEPYFGEASAPSVFIALAETATALGQGVFEAWLERHPDQGLFLQSSRYRLAGYELLEFEENHSHASDHLIHLPNTLQNPEARAMFDQAKTLVLIDDEMSTGSTFLNLAKACVAKNPALERIFLLTLTDWAGEKRTALLEAMPRPTTVLSLLRGQFAWQPNPSFQLQPTQAAHGNGLDKTGILSRNFSRLGSVARLELDCVALLERDPRSARLLGTTGEHVLVLGTGEFSFPPLVLAQFLEGLGHQVFFQTTTRSPILLGGAIEKKLELSDNYFDQIPNYVYNLDPSTYAHILIGYETPLLPPEHAAWLESVGAIGVFF